MTIEYLAPGIKCDLACKYCYQNPMREAGNFAPSADWEKVRAEIERQNADFTVFGGEVLLTPKEHLQEVFEFGFKRRGKNGVQTNLLRLDADHIAMFKKYNVHVGVSIDGPWPLNEPRSTEEQTNRIIENLVELLYNGIVPSLIITVHRANGLWDRLHTLCDFVSWLRGKGVQSFNFHILEADNPEIQRTLGLTNEENLIAFTELYKISSGASPFTDIYTLLTASPAPTNCTWNGCDSLTTPAVQGVMPDGSLSNCGRTNKDGVNWVKNTDKHKYERYQALYQTPQEVGGCKGCKYFYACKGQCPGTAIDNDWRNKTAHCEFWYGLMAFIEADLIRRGIPVLREEQMMKMGSGVMNPNHQDSPHVDTPHVDWHQDHVDIFVDTFKTYTIQELINNAKA